MPKKPVKKRGREHYSQTAVKEALRRVDFGELSMRAASREYGIPQTTLRDKASGRSPLYAQKGPEPFLSPGEEERIADWVIGMVSSGQRCKQNDVQKVT